MEAKKSNGGQKGGQNGQTGKGAAMLMVKAREPKKMAAYNAFKVAEWIGDFAGRGPEVKVERTKEANLLVTCSTLGGRKLAVQKMFGDVEVEIAMGVAPEENECKGFTVWMWS